MPITRRPGLSVGEVEVEVAGSEVVGWREGEERRERR